MFKEILGKFKEASLSILPVTCIIAILFLVSLIPNAFPTADGAVLIETADFGAFILCALFLIVGFVLFDYGADGALARVGSYIGANITKKGNMILVATITVLLGVLVTIAEPDLSILSDQLANSIDPRVLKITVGCGVGVFFFIGLLRILLNKSIKYFYIFGYFLIFGIACLYGPSSNSSAFISLAFDTSGVSTGAAATPFVIAFGASVASTRGGKDTSNNSFGVAGLMSIGPIIAMLVMCLPQIDSLVLTNTQELESVESILISSLSEVAYGILPILGFFLVYNFLFLKLNKHEIIRILFGFLYAYLGLYCFVCSAKIGFIPLGYKLGETIAANDNLYYLYILLPIVIGIVIVLAEPSIHVLNQQVEEISGGVIGKKSMMISLCLGVSLAITLEVCRIVFWDYFSVLYFYVPVFLAIGFLALFVDDIYVALAFDSGGTASGTLCVCFVLPFILGTIEILNDKNGTNYSGFGISGIVSVFPVLAIEIMGLIAKFKKVLLEKRARQRVYEEANDAQIIHF